MYSNVTFSDRIVVRTNTQPRAILDQIRCHGSLELLESQCALEKRLATLRGNLTKILFDAISKVDAPARKTALTLKRSIRSGSEPISVHLPEELYHQIPLLKEAVSDWNEISNKLQSVSRRVIETLDREYGQARSGLRRILECPDILEGLLLSSSELYAEAGRYLHAIEPDKSSKAFERSFSKHLARACINPTPRGLLAGVSTFEMSQPQQVEKTRFWRKTYLSLHTAKAIARHISQSESIWRRVVPRPNNTAIRVGEVIQFYRQSSPQSSPQAPSEVPAHPIISDFLRLTERRALTASAVILEIAKKHTKSAEEIATTYRKLCQLELLVGDIEIPFECRDGIAFLIDWLVNEGEGTQYDTLLSVTITQLKKIQQLLHEADQTQSVARRIEIYHQIPSQLVPLLPKTTATGPISSLVIVDCGVPPESAQIDEKTISNIRHTLQTLSEMIMHSSFEEQSKKILRSYITQHGTSVDSGSHYSLPLLSLLGLDPIHKIEHERHRIRYAQVFSDWINEHCRKPIDSLDIVRDGLLARVKSLPRVNYNPEFSNALIRFQTVTSQSGDDLVVIKELKKDYLPAFARVSVMYEDLVLASSLRDYSAEIEKQYADGALRADVLSLGFSKADSALIYPSMHSKVIEDAWVKTQRPTDEVIPARELFLHCSADSKDILLLWRRGKSVTRIIPRYISHMADSLKHATTQVLAVLGSLPGLIIETWLPWSASALEYVPRIQIGSVVLQPKKWRIPRLTLPADSTPESSSPFIKWNRWRLQAGLPQYVNAGASPTLFVDFSIPFLVEALDRLIANQTADTVEFCEVLPSPLEMPKDTTHESEFLLGAHWSSE